MNVKKEPDLPKEPPIGTKRRRPVASKKLQKDKVEEDEDEEEPSGPE